MLFPSRRWYFGAAGLAALAIVGVWWPPGTGWMIALDVIWVLLLVADGLLVVDPATLEVDREAPPAFSLGRTMPVTYRWRHHHRGRVTVRVRETFPEPLGGAEVPERLLTLPPNQIVTEIITITPTKRGTDTAGRIAVRVRGPLGLIWRQGKLEREWTGVVFPSLEGIVRRGLPTTASRRKEAGLRSQRRIGEGRVFESLREWVPGDDTRSIDWKATARRGKLMARVFEDERRQHVVLVIDAGRLLTTEIGGIPRLESVITAALHLAQAAIEHDDNVGLMVFAREVELFLPPARGRRALRGILNGLAAIEGRLVESDYPAAFRYLAARNRRRSLTVVFSDVIDRTASEALVTYLGSLRPRHLPLAVTLTDPVLESLASTRPDSVAAAFDRAAAEELLIAREEALAAVRRRGVLVLDVPPDRASDAVVEQYTQLKRKGVL